MFNSLIEKDITHPKVEKAFARFQLLLGALADRELPDEVINCINDSIELINQSDATGRRMLKTIKRASNQILMFLADQTGLVPGKYYTRRWMILGMMALGQPLGSVLSTYTGNYARLTIGPPIGMAIGLAIGVVLDKKAKANGKQLGIQ